MNKETIINSLMYDYGQYLTDFNYKELKMIADSGGFTLREAKLLKLKCVYCGRKIIDGGYFIPPFQHFCQRCLKKVIGRINENPKG